MKTSVVYPGMANETADDAAIPSTIVPQNVNGNTGLGSGLKRIGKNVLSKSPPN